MSRISINHVPAGGAQPAPAIKEGSFGRFTVVIGASPGSPVNEVALYSPQVGLWDRLVNWITGSLNREKIQP
jgi:hypothetical protein